MHPIPDVTKNLLIINCLVFLAQLTFPSVTNHLALYTPGISDNFEPYQIVTYMFLHSPEGIGHLFFNMLSLYMFGLGLEQALGAKKYLFLYLSAGLGAAFLHSGVMYWEIHNFVQTKLAEGYPAEQVQAATNMFRTVGASGSIFGLLAAYGMLYPNKIIMLLFPPIPMKAKYFVLLFGAAELYSGLAGSNTGVAHFAHIGGAVIGLVLILLWRRQGEKF
jgi:membrane associated rhomboid family serine protease